MKKNELEKRIREEVDFIHCPKHQNSLTRFFMKNEQPLENGAIGRLLMISSKEVEAIYQESVLELRKKIIQNQDSE
jgi:hypothetical protein